MSDSNDRIGQVGDYLRGLQSEIVMALETVDGKAKFRSDRWEPRVTPAKNTVVLDENHQLIPAGDERIGLLAKGGFIPLSYFKDEKKTAETFITTAEGVRYVIPGDMARHNEAKPMGVSPLSTCPSMVAST